MELSQVKVGKWSVRGIAVSGMYSVVALDNYKVLFDMGFVTPALAKYPTVLVTHGHHDHCGALYRHNRFRRLSRDQIQNWEPPTYIVPKVCMTGIKQMYLGFLNLDSGREDSILEKLHPNYIPLKPTETWDISDRVYAKAFETQHRVPSQGYTIYEKRTKLRQEFALLSGKAIAEKRKAGENVTTEIHIPTVSYTGDTLIEGVVCHPDVLRSELLIMECTFLDDQIDPDEAHKRGHIHIYDIMKHQKAFENKHILLVHFSNRYKSLQIKNILKNYFEMGKFTKTFYSKLHCLV